MRRHGTLDRSWRKLFGAIVAIALGSSSAFALPKSRPDDTGERPGDPEDVPEEPGPRPRPDRPRPKPQIPGYVLFKGAYYRETTLPLCEWGQGERSFLYQFIRVDGRSEAWPWTCLGADCYDEETGSYLNNTCSFSGPPGDRPMDAAYTLAPLDYWEQWYADLDWSNGTAAYGGWFIKCARNPSSVAVTDTVVQSVFEGVPWNDGSVCPGWPHQGRQSRLIAELVGGDVEHVRPAIVRALATIGHYESHGGTRNLPNDLVLAIQVFGSSGWEDFKTLVYTTSTQPSLYELEATVPEGSSVRVQVRGTEECIGFSNGDGYDIRSLRIQVETCIPDENNPGNCL